MSSHLVLMQINHIWHMPIYGGMGTHPKSLLLLGLKISVQNSDHACCECFCTGWRDTCSRDRKLSFERNKLHVMLSGHKLSRATGLGRHALGVAGLGVRHARDCVP